MMPARFRLPRRGDIFRYGATEIKSQLINAKILWDMTSYVQLSFEKGKSESLFAQEYSYCCFASVPDFDVTVFLSLPCSH